MVKVLFVVIILAIVSSWVNQARSQVQYHVEYKFSFDLPKEKCYGATLDEEKSTLIKDKLGVYHLLIRFNCGEEA